MTRTAPVISQQSAAHKKDTCPRSPGNVDILAVRVPDTGSVGAGAEEGTCIWNEEGRNLDDGCEEGRTGADTTQGATALPLGHSGEMSA